MKSVNFFETCKFFLIFIFMLFSVVCFTTGCGRKAPPRPPDLVSPLSVNDLGKRIDGDALQLTWTIPEGNKKDKTQLAGFAVYRSKLSVADGDCTNCPLIFEKIGDVSVYNSDEHEGRKNTSVFYDTLEMGYSYTYKVVGYTKNDVKSGDSNSIQFYY